MPASTAEESITTIRQPLSQGRHLGQPTPPNPTQPNPTTQPISTQQNPTQPNPVVPANRAMPTQMATQTEFWEQVWFAEAVADEVDRALAEGHFGPPLEDRLGVGDIRRLYAETVRRPAAASASASASLDTQALVALVAAQVGPHAGHALAVTVTLAQRFQERQDRLDFPVPASAPQQQGDEAGAAGNGLSPAEAADRMLELLGERAEMRASLLAQAGRWAACRSRGPCRASGPAGTGAAAHRSSRQSRRPPALHRARREVGSGRALERLRARAGGGAAAEAGRPAGHQEPGRRVLGGDGSAQEEVGREGADCPGLGREVACLEGGTQGQLVVRGARPQAGWLLGASTCDPIPCCCCAGLQSQAGGGSGGGGRAGAGRRPASPPARLPAALRGAHGARGRQLARGGAHRQRQDQHRGGARQVPHMMSGPHERRDRLALRAVGLLSQPPLPSRPPDESTHPEPLPPWRRRLLQARPGAFVVVLVPTVALSVQQAAAFIAAGFLESGWEVACHSGDDNGLDHSSWGQLRRSCSVVVMTAQVRCRLGLAWRCGGCRQAPGCGAACAAGAVRAHVLPRACSLTRCCDRARAAAGQPGPEGRRQPGRHRPAGA